MWWQKGPGGKGTAGIKALGLGGVGCSRNAVWLKREGEGVRVRAGDGWGHVGLKG